MVDRHKPRHGYQAAYQSATREAARRWKLEHGDDAWRQLLEEVIGKDHQP